MVRYGRCEVVVRQEDVMLACDVGSNRAEAMRWSYMYVREGNCNTLAIK